VETKHTPGPWKVDQAHSGKISITAQRNDVICAIAENLYDENNEPTIEELTANARLIKAAPILLDAVQKALEASEHADITLMGRLEATDHPSHLTRTLLNAVYQTTRD
jgi:hypothetical protein